MELKALEKLFYALATPLEKLFLSNPTGYWTALAALALIGLSYGFFGYRFHHYLLIFFGFLMGTGVGLFISQYLPIHSGENTAYIQMGLGLIVGLLFAIFSPQFMAFFLFSLGGGAMALALLPISDQLPNPHDKVILLIGFGGGGIFALLLKRPIIIISTAILGSYLLANAVFSIGLNHKYLKPPPNMTLFSGIWLAIAAVGIIFQFVNSPKPEKDDVL